MLLKLKMLIRDIYSCPKRDKILTQQYFYRIKSYSIFKLDYSQVQ